MPANTTPIFPLTIQNSAVSFAAADTTTTKTLTTAGANGTRVDSISAVNTGAADVTLNVFLHDGTTAHQVGSIVVPNLTGVAGAPALSILDVNAFPWLDASGSLWLKTGWSLRFAATATMTSGAVTLVAAAGDY